jgi:hypothetical protein
MREGMTTEQTPDEVFHLLPLLLRIIRRQMVLPMKRLFRRWQSTQRPQIKLLHHRLNRFSPRQALGQKPGGITEFPVDDIPVEQMQLSG